MGKDGGRHVGKPDDTPEVLERLEQDQERQARAGLPCLLPREGALGRLRRERLQLGRPLALEGHNARLCAGITHGPAEALALCARVGQPCLDPLDDDLALELGEGADDMEEQPPHGRGGVNGLRVADEAHAEVAKLL